jgi:hypothetical protein
MSRGFLTYCLAVIFISTHSYIQLQEKVFCSGHVSIHTVKTKFNRSYYLTNKDIIRAQIYPGQECGGATEGSFKFEFPPPEHRMSGNSFQCSLCR